MTPAYLSREGWTLLWSDTSGEAWSSPWDGAAWVERRDRPSVWIAWAPGALGVRYRDLGECVARLVAAR